MEQAAAGGVAAAGGAAADCGGHRLGVCILSMFGPRIATDRTALVCTALARVALVCTALVSHVVVMTGPPQLSSCDWAYTRPLVFCLLSVANTVLLRRVLRQTAQNIRGQKMSRYYTSTKKVRNMSGVGIWVSCKNVRMYLTKKSAI